MEDLSFLVFSKKRVIHEVFFSKKTDIQPTQLKINNNLMAREF